MADNMKNQAYLAYISKAIEDFDKIYGKLVAKGVAVYPTVGSDNKYDTGVATSEYANLISNLYAIKDGNNFITPSTSTVAKLTTIDRNVTGAVDTASGVVTFTGLPEGFITTTTIVSTTIETESATFANFKANEEGTSYVYTPNGKIVKDVTLTKGSVSIDAGAFTHTRTAATGDIVGATAVGTGIASGVIGTEYDANNTYDSNDKFIPIEISPSFKVGCTHTISLDKTKGYDFTAGYIEDITLQDTTLEIPSVEEEIPVEGFKIYLKKAALSNVTANGDIGFSESDITGISKPATGSNYYTIKANAALNISGTIDPGYIDSSTKLESSTQGGDSIAAEMYLAKATLGDVTLSADEFKTVVTDEDSIGAAVGTTKVNNKYNISVNLPNVSKTITASEGYLKEDDASFSITGTGGTKYISIDHGSIKTKTAASLSGIGTLAGFSTALPTGAVASEYSELTLSLSATNVLDTAAGGFTEGYIKEGDYTLSAGTGSASVFIKNQKVTSDTVGIKVEAIDAGKDPATVEILSKTAPTGIKPGDDYYRLTATSSATVSAGYSESGTTLGQTEYYYLPKATLEYVEDSTMGNFIQVTSGGYLPTGTLTSITDITGEIDVARVEVGLSGAIKNGKYVVTAVCDTTKSNAGYFDASESFISNTIEIPVGSVTTDADITSTSFVKADKKDNSSYTLTVNAVGSVLADVSEGYIRPEDLTVNTQTGKDNVSVSFNKDTTFDITKAVISGVSSDASVDVASTASGFAFASETETAFSITTVLGTDKTIKAKATTGYIKEEDSEVSLTVGATAQTYYLKEATVGTISATTTASPVTIKTNFADNVTGAYTIDLAENSAVAATATIGEGYTKEATATGSVAVKATAVSVAHGSVTGTVDSKSNVITSGTSGLTVYSSDAKAKEVSNKTFKITATDTIVASASVTPGYVKSSDVSKSAAETSTGNAYLAGYDGTIDGDDYVINNAFVITSGDEAGTAVDSETIATAGKYVDKNIVINLHGDAMGTNVRSELEKLELRLSGKYVSKV